MKCYRTLLFAVVCTISAFAIVTYSACTKDPCKKANCLNGATCDDGRCVCPTGFSGIHCEKDVCANVNCLNGGHCELGECKCPTGYEGAECDKLSSAKFMGDWKGKNECDPEWAGGGTYLHISDGTTPTEVNVGMAFYLPGPITGVLTSANSITLPETQVSSTSRLERGTLTLLPDGKRLWLQYTMTMDVAGDPVAIECSSTFEAP
ncbi:MAG: uncharacterized protein K0R82_2252 [Flavipsychrobacter sp.]|jgi:hypothetical protein|nr:uncharacterized protein [Flavipsychrobacter sp.]